MSGKGNRMKRVIWAALAVALVGCGKEVVFPKGNLLSVKAEKDMSQYKLGFEEVMAFTENELGEYVIVAAVPNDTPVVTVEGLPDTASFSGSDFRISWRPPVGAAKSSRPGYHFQTYPIRIHLKGSTDVDDVLVRTAVLVVFEEAKL